MALTEVVYTIKSDYPLARYTAEHEDAKVVYNKITYDGETGRGRAMVTAVGPKEDYQALAKLIHDLFEDAVPLKEGEDFATFKVGLDIERLREENAPEVFALTHFGKDAMIEPGLVKEGYLHSRVIVPNEIDMQALLAEYKQGVEDGLWQDFKLIRVDDFAPEQQILGSFDNDLTPKQLEVIKVAHALGFYDTPRKSTLDDISAIFGISKAAVHNRLQSAERKVIGEFFG